MKPTEQDYDYLIDQLSNSMEFCESRGKFIEEVSAVTNLWHTQIGIIWDSYQLLDGKTAFDMNKYDWYEWIKKLIN